MCTPEGATADLPQTQCRVLVVDDDDGTREVLQWALRDVGIKVASASCGRDGLSRARAERFDLILLDLSMPDLSGVEVVQLLQASGSQPRFMMFSAFLTTSTTVQAMRLGAIDVIDKMTDIDDVVSRIEQAARSLPARDATALETAAIHATVDLVSATGSSAERWACYVIRGCRAPMDLKTFNEWGRYVGASASVLRESSRLIRIRPRDGRDLMRVLRAVLRSQYGYGQIAAQLRVGDRRTLRELLRRGGLPPGLSAPLDANSFLELQTFVSRSNEGLVALVPLLQTLHIPRADLANHGTQLREYGGVS